jgi:predicted nucleic acid-binding protein
VIVLDSSFTLALVLPDEDRPASAHAVLAAPLACPMIWPLEIANALRSNLRRGRLDAAGADDVFQRLHELQVDVINAGDQQPRRLFEAAQTHDLTPYDATYLALAQQLSSPLATRDANLARAARRAGIVVFE